MSDFTFTKSTMMSSQEKFEFETNVKKKPTNPKIIRIAFFAFLLLLILVGLLAGFLSAKQARKDAEVKCAREKLEGEKEKKGTTSPPTFVTTTPTFVTTTPTFVTTTKRTICQDIWCFVRLPKHVIPYHYNLELTSHVDMLQYNGTQEILFQVVQPIDVVIVHIKKIRIDSVTLKHADSDVNLGIESSFDYPENEYYVTELKKNMTVGNYSFVIKFHSNVSKTLTGFYKSSYQHQGTERTLLTTKFQPTDARRAFPCLDEPDLKASFNITMNHRKEYHTRSNMPGTVISSKEKGWLTTTFGETVKMSPYLICFIVSQFESKYEGETGNQNTSISIWSQPDLVNSTEYAYNTSITMLAFLEDFLGVDYPMPKLDMFAIPDYGSGATEHWGIITYRESRLLYTPGVSSEENKVSIAGIIAHEAAHLWFGNLVTCKWWNDLWVQEGMASYLENYAINHTHPEWNQIDTFLSADWKRGMTLDSYASSHPISQPVDHPKQIKEIFDAITYSKGASLFQMLDYYLGVEKFRKALKRYLVDNQYKGATVNDLWSAFDSVSGENITSMMDTWTHQMGFPVITIKKTGDGFSLEQKHFLVDPMAAVTVDSPYDYRWIVPFTYATNDDLSTHKTKMIKGEKDSLKTSAKWILGNYNHRGFYRVNYDGPGWKNIQEQLKNDHNKISAVDRAGLIDDAFTLARAGQLNYSTALDMLSFIDKDLNSLVWSMAISNLNYIDSVLKSQDVYSLYRTFIAKKVETVLYDKGEIKSSYMGIAAKYGVQSVVKHIKEIFNEWMVNGTEIPADIRPEMYYYGIAYGGDKEWDHVFKKYMGETNPSVRSNLQYALGATQKPWLLNKWLRSSLNSSIVKSQDTVYVIGYVASGNPVGKYLAWDFANANWNAIMAIAEENNFHVAHITSRLTRQFTTEYELEMTKELWKKYPDAKTGAKAREQGIEKIKGNIYWLQQNYDTLEQWLKKRFNK